MGEIVDFIGPLYDKWAGEFLELLETRGKTDANEWARKNVPPMHRPGFRDYLRNVLTMRGRLK